MGECEKISNVHMRIILILALLAALLLGGQTPSPIQQKNFQRDLDALTKRGFTYRMLDNDLIELTDPASGEKHLKSTREPSEATIRSWAAQRGIPILEIDPNTIDTSQYTGWYGYWTTVPLGNSTGNPLVIGDVDHNVRTDVYGGYLDTLTTDFGTRVYEVDSAGIVLLRHQYTPRPGVSRQFADADRDSLHEVVFSLGGIVSGYEQPSQDSLAIYRSYAHDRHYHNADPSFTGIYIGDLDGDSLTDFLYQGTGPDPKDTNIAISKTYIAEFDPVFQIFARVWSTQFYPGSGAAGFAVGDFDNDGKMEFVATHSRGEVYVAENTGDNTYNLAWQDSTPFVNFYYQGSGDVDNDGKIEFFTGATMSNGNWVLMYETDSNNTYSAKFLFHLRSGGVFAEPIYTTVDIDGDEKLELAMLVGADLYVFKSNMDNQYCLWFLKRENTADGVAFYDFNHDGRKDFIISKFGVNSQGRGWTYAETYLASTLVSVMEQTLLPSEIQLSSNYPNPFNPVTTISYDLPIGAHVSLMVYDVLGREVTTLVDGFVEAGYHRETLNAGRLASGVYFYRIQAGSFVQTKKLLLLR
jgi:hypothetical protein